MLNFVLQPCCRNLFKNADLFCHDHGFIFQLGRRAYTHGKAGSRLDCYQLQWTHWWRWMASELAWPTMSEELCLNATSHFNPSRRTSMSSRKFCSWYGTSCHRTRMSFRKTSGLCESRWWTLQTNAEMNYLSDCGICNNSKCFLTMKITSCCWLLRAELKIWHRIFIQP